MKKNENSKQAEMDVGNLSPSRNWVKNPIHDKPVVTVSDDGREQATSREVILRLIDKIRKG